MRERTEKEEEHMWGLGGDHTHFTYIKYQVSLTKLWSFTIDSQVPYSRIRIVWVSLVVPWLRLCLTAQGTPAQPLAGEDPTCCRATKPVHHDDFADGLQLMKPVRPGVCAL